MGEQLKFFMPLGITQMFISFTHSLFNAAFTKLPSPEISIAAFAIAKSLLQMVQNPISMIKQTVTALVEDEDSYQKVRKFTMVITAVVTLIFAFFAFTGLSKIALQRLLGVEGEVLEEAVSILKALMLFPVFVSLRNFMQGISIKFKMTAFIPIAALLRVVYVALMVIFIEKFMWIPSGILAGLLFLTSMMVESGFVFVTTKLMIKNIPKKLESIRLQQRIEEYQERKFLSYRLILSFFGPLFITALMRTLARPIINAGLARSISPEVALASYAVAWGLGTIVVSPLMMFHQVPLNFLGKDRDEEKVKAIQIFGIYTATALSGTIALMGFTPIGGYIVGTLIGADANIMKPALEVLRFMTLLPFAVMVRQYYWGILMKRKKTQYISNGKTVNLIALSVTIFIVTLIKPNNPAIIGIIGMISSETFESLYLYLKNKTLM